MIKSIKLTIMLMLVCAGTHLVGAPTNQEIFLQANAAYRTHDYERALALYDQISNKGPVVWYNMGNCAYQLKRYPYAYIYWKKSEQGASWALLNDAEHNLALVAHPDEPVSMYNHSAHMVRMYVQWSSLWWLQVMLLLIWCVFLLLYVHRTLRFLQPLVLLLVCCCGIALKGKYTDMGLRNGIVVHNQAPVYTGPDTQFYRITMLDEMATVTVVQQDRDWYKISYKNQVGWMPASVIASV
ncbi:MAG: SH3 domain-containing protein [Candidatus Babeliales bacterium]